MKKNKHFIDICDAKKIELTCIKCQAKIKYKNKLKEIVVDNKVIIENFLRCTSEKCKNLNDESFSCTHCKLTYPMGIMEKHEQEIIANYKKELCFNKEGKQIFCRKCNAKQSKDFETFLNAPNAAKCKQCEKYICIFCEIQTTELTKIKSHKCKHWKSKEEEKISENLLKEKYIEPKKEKVENLIDYTKGNRQILTKQKNISENLLNKKDIQLKIEKGEKLTELTKKTATGIFETIFRWLGLSKYNKLFC